MTSSDHRANSRRFILGFVALTLIFIGLAWARQTRAQDPQPVSVSSPAPYPVEAIYSGAGSVIASSLNIRTGPHVSYSSVAYLMEGQRVALVGRNAASTWAQIELPNGFRGWVNARYLLTNVPVLFLPVVSRPWANATAMVTDEGLYIYMGPGWVYRAVELTQPGNVLRLLGRDVRADWYFVALADGRTGWTPANGPLLPSVYIQDLPITTPLIDYLPTGIADQYQIYIGPAYYYQFFDEVAAGQSVAIVGRNEDGTWLRVRLPDGREGWVDGSVLSLPLSSALLPPLPEVPATVTPSPTPSPSPMPSPVAIPSSTTAAPLPPPPTTTPISTGVPTMVPTASPQPATATAVPATALPEATLVPVPSPVSDPGSHFFIYPLPDTNTVPLLVLTAGQQLGLLGRTADGAWVKVAFGDGDTGWVLAQLLQANINVALLPVVEP